jgi:hypothetical protein
LSHFPKPIGGTVLASALMMPCTGLADEPNIPSLWAAAEGDKTAARGASQNTIWDTGIGKSYWIPALEIIGFDVLLNQVDRHFVDRSGTYNSNRASIIRNFHSGWVEDRDRFDINQLGHPYRDRSIMDWRARRALVSGNQPRTRLPVVSSGN